MLILDRARVIGHAYDGAVKLPGAHVRGEFSCTGADLRNDSGSGLSAHGLQVDRDMFLNHGFTAAGTGYFGAVSLVGAHIGGYVQCAGAKFHNNDGPGLAADSLQVARRAWCAGANRQDGGPGPVVHGDPAGQRGTRSQPAGGHQRGPRKV